MPKQAIVESTTPRAGVRTFARRALDAALAVFSAEVAAEPHRSIIILPIRNDLLPPFRCGQFVKVDTRDCHPEIGAYFAIRFGKGDVQVVLLHEWRSAKEDFYPNHYTVRFGRCQAWTLAGKPLFQDTWSSDFTPPGVLKEMIVGRVIGVLGASDGGQPAND